MSKTVLKPALSLKRNFTWTFFGNVIYAFSQWVIIATIAKFGTPEIVGRFALGLAICTPIVMFTNCQLRSLMVTDAKDVFTFHEYLAIRFISSGLAILIIAVVVVTSGYDCDTASVILLVAGLKIVESISDLHHGMFQHHERMDLVSSSLMIRGGGSSILFALVYILSRSILGALLGLIFLWLIILVVFEKRRLIALKQEDKPMGYYRSFFSPNYLSSCVNIITHEFKKLLSIVKLAFPLGVVMMLLSLNTSIPRFFLESSFGQSELGIFAAIASFMRAGYLIVNALGQSASPRLAKLYASSKKREYTTLMMKLIAFGIFVGGAGLVITKLVGVQVLLVCFGDAYASHTALLQLIMIAMGIGCVTSFLGYGMTAARLFQIQVPISLVLVITTLVSCYYLIPSMGVHGAAWAVIISLGVQTTGGLVVNCYALGRTER